MKTNLTKKQLIVIAAIIIVSVFLAVLILLPTSSEKARVDSSPPAQVDKVPAEVEGVAKKSVEPAETGEAKVAIADAALKASGITLQAAGTAKINASLTLPGEIQFNEDRTAHVVPRLAGVVEAVKVSLGQRVAKGEVLAVIASTDLSEQRSELLTAQKKVALARVTFVREARLWKEKVSAEQDYLQARQSLAEAEIDQQNAKQKLSALGASTGSSGGLNRFELRAPFAGTIVEKHIALGESVKEDANVFTISDLSTVWAEVAVPASSLNSVRVGRKVTVKASSFDATSTGTIGFVGSLLGEQTRTAKARVVLSNPDASWRPGLFVTVDIEDAAGQSDIAIAVASDAIQSVEDKPTVFVRVPGGFVAQHITVGRSDAKSTEVTSGLKAGTQYAATGSFVIKAELGKSEAEHDD